METHISNLRKQALELLNKAALRYNEVVDAGIEGAAHLRAEQDYISITSEDTTQAELHCTHELTPEIELMLQRLSVDTVFPPAEVLLKTDTPSCGQYAISVGGMLYLAIPGKYVPAEKEIKRMQARALQNTILLATAQYRALEARQALSTLSRIAIQSGKGVN